MCPRPATAVLEDFAEYLALERGRSAHTQRAYLGDLRSLFDFLDQRAPGAELAELTLPVLRSWLAAQAGAGAARTTLARRTSAVKTFIAWADATRTGAAPTRPPGCRCPGRTGHCPRCCARIRRSSRWPPPNPVRPKVIRWRCATG